MTDYDYLIIGGGQVADDASRAIRKGDPKGSIGIISADKDAPYSRPALSKKLWTDPEFTVEQDFLDTAEDTGAQLWLDTTVTRIDRENQRVEVGDADPIGYGRLLLATGSSPTSLPAPDDERVIPFRSLDDYRTLRRLAKPDARAVVIGGGYIGTELAAALAGEGVKQVQLVFSGTLLGEQRLPKSLAERHTELFRSNGVELLSGHHAEKVETDGTDLVVVLDDGTRLPCDVVAVGLGSEPNLALAEQAGLHMDDGVVVDEHLRTSDPRIWAAGDIASYPDVILGRTRIEHVDNAREMGACAGASMAGSDESYTHTPYFYSQVFGKRWEAIGKTKAELDTLEVPLDDDRMVVYYRDEDGKAVGVLLWQVPDEKIDEARKVLAEAPSDEDELRGRIR